MDWTSIVTDLGTFAIGSFAVLLALRLLAPHLLSLNLERYRAELKASSDRDLEGYKAELKVRHEMEMERLRTDLQQITFQQETTFAKLHEKRAEIIAELYSRLLKFQRSVGALLNPVSAHSPNLQQREQRAVDAGNLFLEYYSQNRIYFDESLCSQLNDFLEIMSNAHLAHALYPVTDPNPTESWEERCKAWDTLNGQAPAIRREIERSFRQLLGLTVQELEHKGILPKGK